MTDTYDELIGRELDAAVAVEIMGYRKASSTKSGMWWVWSGNRQPSEALRPYSSSPNASMLMLEEMRKRGWNVKEGYEHHHDGNIRLLSEWYCGFWTVENKALWEKTFIGYDPNCLMTARARAALRAVRAEKGVDDG